LGAIQNDAIEGVLTYSAYKNGALRNSSRRLQPASQEQVDITRRSWSSTLYGHGKSHLG
jgi:hypothetical protein